MRTNDRLWERAWLAITSSVDAHANLLEKLMGSVWSLAIIIGPILLIGAVIFAWFKNRNTSERLERKADEGARDLREEIAEKPHKNMDL
jgi:hypothetical protein